MPDREKVIKGLELCEIGSGDRCYETECPYYDQGCTESLKNNILELLKEQEATKPKTGHWIFESSYYEAWSHTCSECGKRMTTAINMYANWCWNCGAKMEGR